MQSPSDGAKWTQTTKNYKILYIKKGPKSQSERHCVMFLGLYGQQWGKRLRWKPNTGQTTTHTFVRPVNRGTKKRHVTIPSGALALPEVCFVSPAFKHTGPLFNLAFIFIAPCQCNHESCPPQETTVQPLNHFKFT